MDKISLKEQKKRLVKIMEVCRETNSPHSHLEGVITQGAKKKVECHPWLTKYHGLEAWEESFSGF